jgi:hypothetical protein
MINYHTLRITDIWINNKRYYLTTCLEYSEATCNLKYQLYSYAVAFCHEDKDTCLVYMEYYSTKEYLYSILSYKKGPSDTHHFLKCKAWNRVLYKATDLICSARAIAEEQAINWCYFDKDPEDTYIVKLISSYSP